MSDGEAQAKVHEAIGGLLDEGELAVSWVLTIDVAGPDSTRCLSHHAGGGIDGADRPMVWTALGMLRTSVLVAEAQLAENRRDRNDDV